MCVRACGSEGFLAQLSSLRSHCIWIRRPSFLIQPSRMVKGRKAVSVFKGHVRADLDRLLKSTYQVNREHPAVLDLCRSVHTHQYAALRLAAKALRILNDPAVAKARARPPPDPRALAIENSGMFPLEDGPVVDETEEEEEAFEIEFMTNLGFGPELFSDSDAEAEAASSSSSPAAASSSSSSPAASSSSSSPAARW